MKKIFGLVMAGVCAFVLSACGEEKSSQPASAATEPATVEHTLDKPAAAAEEPAADKEAPAAEKDAPAQ